MGGLNYDFIVVIRSSGERTLKACREIIEGQAEGKPVYIVEEKPFKNSMEKGFKMAIDNNAKWLITADADMLMLPNVVELLLEHAEKMPEEYVQLQGKIYDKITGTIRKAGPRVYRSALLGKMIAYSEKSEFQIRPESSLINKMGADGYPSRYIPAVTSLHDFEQYYKDLYRKAYIHAKKHRELLAGIFENCIENVNDDPDYLVILQAAVDGLTQDEPVDIDTRMFDEKSSRALQELNLEEKSELYYDRQWITQLPNTVPGMAEYDKPITPLDYKDQPEQDKSLARKIFMKIKYSGLFRSIAHSAGVRLQKAGKKFQKL